MGLFSFLSSTRRSLARSKAEVAIAEATRAVTRATGVPTFRRSMPELMRELGRARRYGRPLSVVVLSLGNGHLTEEVNRANGSNGNAGQDVKLLTKTSQVASVVFGWVLQEALRDSDTLTYFAPDNRYVILMTESTQEQARKAIERLSGLYYQRTLDHLRAGNAEFPGNGLTLEELVTSAQKAWHEQPLSNGSEKTLMDKSE